MTKEEILAEWEREKRMPEWMRFELTRARMEHFDTARELLRHFVEVAEFDDERGYCLSCERNVSKYLHDKPEPHADDCKWLRAKRFVEDG